MLQYFKTLLKIVALMGYRALLLPIVLDDDENYTIKFNKINFYQIFLMDIKNIYES